MKIAIAGATGFVGTNLLQDLAKDKDNEIIALTRRNIGQISQRLIHTNVRWTRVDSYSLPELEGALQGVDTIVYLIHSMLPSATLLQGDFWEFDAYLADNFSRAADTCKVPRIVYLGGLIPDVKDLSAHLESRREVEGILGSRSAALTTLRAGLVVGKGGSSFRIMEQLVRRLPVMVCPSWTDKLSQPIDVRDVISLLNCVLSDSKYAGKTFDIGGPECLNYRKMLELTARELSRPVRFFKVPILSPRLSRLWVSTVTGVPRSLVYPLVDSLKHEMVVRPQQQLTLEDPIPFQQSLAESLDKNEIPRFSISRFLNLGELFRIHKDVRSIQRIDNPNGLSAEDVLNEYVNWLPTVFSKVIVSKRVGDKVQFRFFNLFSFLELTRSFRSTKDRCVLYITGGVLVRRPVYDKGRLEFREIDKGRVILCNLQDFRPSLPWFVYKYTQASVHLFVIELFKKQLKKNN